MSLHGKIRLGVFAMLPRHHLAAWRDPDTRSDAADTISEYVSVAALAEQGLFELVQAGYSVPQPPAGRGDCLRRRGYRTGMVRGWRRGRFQCDAAGTTARVSRFRQNCRTRAVASRTLPDPLRVVTRESWFRVTVSVHPNNS